MESRVLSWYIKPLDLLRRQEYEHLRERPGTHRPYAHGSSEPDQKNISTTVLAKLEGIFAGYSAGANIFAGLKIAAGLEEDKTVLTIIPDSGTKYLSTELFRHSPDIHCCTLEHPKAREECLKGKQRCCVLEPC